MSELVADAMHAWWEYMPARVDYDPEGVVNLEDVTDAYRQ